MTIWRKVRNALDAMEAERHADHAELFESFTASFGWNRCARCGHLPDRHAGSCAEGIMLDAGKPVRPGIGRH